MTSSGSLGRAGLACPACGGVLAGWGWARRRQLRGPGGLPRAVTLQSLVAAYAGRKATVDEASTRIAITEVTSD